MIEELEGWYMDNTIDMSDNGDGEQLIDVNGELVALDECIDNLHDMSDELLKELYHLYIKSKLVVPDTMKGVLDSIQVGFKK